jgi:cytochrome c-type biogenesis protein CcmH/NrfG
MAPLAGLLIEYFVVGAVASLWLGPLLVEAMVARGPDFPKEMIPIVAATLVPAVYLAGMVCDLLGYKLLHGRKAEIEGKVRRDVKLKSFSTQRVHALAVAHEPLLARELEARSTRDRIARGALIASIPLLWLSPFGAKHYWVGTASGVAIVVALYLLWVRTQTLSAKYEIQVIEVLSEKHGVHFARASSDEA